MKRSTFLTVLCILTFIGSAIGIVSGIGTLTTSKITAEVLDENKKNMDKAIDNLEDNKEPGAAAAAKFVKNMSEGFTPEKLKNNAYGQLVAALLCLSGALLMWQLKRNGFFLYLAGTILGVVVPFVVFGTGNIMGIFSAATAAFIGIIFCILYYLNYKELR